MMKMITKVRTRKNIKIMKFSNIFILFIALGIGATLSLKAQVSSKELKTLIEINRELDGENWDRKWNFDEPVSSWHGVEVVDGSVEAINLFKNNLKGEIPENISKLENLKSLNLAFNGINGELPSSITELKELRVLKVEMNLLRGELPTEMGDLRNLIEFTAFNNLITGAIPESLGEIKNLKILNLSSNKLDGSIPRSLGNLTKLESLGLFENSLKGIIPRQIGNLTNLKELVLANNELGGDIPKEFGQLASLEVFQIQNNKFDSFKNLQQMDTKQFLVFDYDKEELILDLKDIDINKTRMADTKFDDDENE